MTEEDKFEVMVKTLVREANDGNEEVDAFEDAITGSGKGWAGFITRDDPDRVDFYQNHTLYTSPREKHMLFMPNIMMDIKPRFPYANGMVIFRN